MRAIRVARKWTMLTHRWMGVVFCVSFFAWFASGIVMMYCRFPRVDPEDRLNRAAPLDSSQVRTTPLEAFKSLHSSSAPSQLRLNVLDGRPVYRFGFGRKSTVVFADNGRTSSSGFLEQER